MLLDGDHQQTNILVLIQQQHDDRYPRLHAEHPSALELHTGCEHTVLSNINHSHIFSLLSFKSRAFLSQLVSDFCPLLFPESTDTSVTTEDPEPAPNIHGSGDYPLAVKMMFNYNVESQADQILSAMAKETVPAQSSLTESVAGIIR